MIAKLCLLTVMFLGTCGSVGGAAAQSLPGNVEPGVQRDRLLDRDALPRTTGPVILRTVDCSAGEIILTEAFELKAVRLDSEVVLGNGSDPAAYWAEYWAEYLGRHITLEQVCKIARELAADDTRKTGRSLSAILPVQRIESGVVRVKIVEK